MKFIFYWKSSKLSTNWKWRTMNFVNFVRISFEILKNIFAGHFHIKSTDHVRMCRKVHLGGYVFLDVDKCPRSHHVMSQKKSSDKEIILARPNAYYAQLSCLRFYKFHRNPAVTNGFPSQRASEAENVSIWWRHHVMNVTPDSARTLSLSTQTQL